ncbi:unnamed protein product [Adineta ricciae]|uniref:Voltage-gated hydrogen channel 1 n=1 Tax=Adineta ricciae TaxID=249248 RepID=A0A815VWT9_ADIRI|nr:unnamed protein product [Adineta ricciae]
MASVDLSTNPISRSTLTRVEEFGKEVNEPESDGCCHDKCCSCFNQWWNVKFQHQRKIMHVVEKTSFHVGIIILVLLDCVLVIAELMLDFLFLNNKCSRHGGKSDSEKKECPGLELAIEILHFGSIFLLAIFVLEVLTKIYAFGRKWWNFREKKMEWVDAIIVLVSFIVDVYFAEGQNTLAEISLLFISLRLWRIVRIINSVAQSIRSQDETAKKDLANTYTQIVESLLDVLTKKTEVAVEVRQELTRENADKMVEKFTSIDRLCRSILAHCPKPSSRNAVTGIAQNLQDALEEVRSSSSTMGIKKITKLS